MSQHTESQLLGEVVTWDLQQADVTHANVQDALRSAGLDPAAAAELSPRSAFSRACKDLKKERAIDKLSVDTKGLARFQFTKKHLRDRQIEYDFECFVELDCDTGAITCASDSALEKMAQDLFATAMQMRNAQDVTRLVQRLFQEHAELFPINPRKGVAYFVPERHRDFTAKVDAFLAACGGCLARFPVPNGTPQGNASVKDAVQAGLSSLISELNATVAGWADTTRQSTMTKAAEKYQTIEFKISAYAEYLGSEQEKLNEKLAEARQELKRKVLELKPETDTLAAA